MGARLDLEPLPTVGFWRRYAAYAVDSLLMAWPADAVLAPYDDWSDRLAQSWLAHARSAAEAQVLSTRLDLADLLVSALLLQAVMALPAALCLASRWQATPGKKLFGLCVVDGAGGRLRLGRALGRELGKLPAALALGLGVLAIGLRRDHRAWYDGWCNTAVVRRWAMPAWHRRHTASITDAAATAP